jgi:prophage regulatory protein
MPAIRQQVDVEPAAHQNGAIAAPGPAGSTLTPLMVGASGFGRLVGLSARSIRRMDASGQIPRPVRCGGSLRWRVADVTGWVAAGCPDRSAWEKSQADSANP